MRALQVMEKATRGEARQPIEMFALAICQRILGDHHGRIQAHNRPGGGAIFSLSLPLPP